MDERVTADFYALMNSGKHREAYDFLLSNHDILAGMTLGETRELYLKFGGVISTGEISGLAKLIVKHGTGHDYTVIVV